MTAYKKTWLAALVVGPLMAGCTADQTSGTEETGEHDVVVGGLDLADKVAVYPDRLEFDADILPKLQDRGILGKLARYAAAPDKAAAEPVFLVGNRQSDAVNPDGSLKDGVRNPSGYLRRGVSWERGANGVIVIKTEPATFAEAIEEIKANGYVGLNRRSIQPLDGQSSESGLGNYDHTWNHTFGPNGDGFTPIDLSGKELWSKKLLTGGQAKLVLKKGKITITPTIDAHVLIDHFIPQNGHAILTTDVHGEIEFEATADGYFELSKGDTIFSRSFGGTTAGVPLTLSIDVKWQCGFGVSGKAVASIGATADGSLRAGAEFQGTNLKGILDPPTYNFERLGPTLTSKVVLKGDCHIITELGVQLFDAVGPQASVDLYAKVDAQASSSQLTAQASASLKAGVEAKVGGSLRPFGIKIADINAPPFTYERELFKGSIQIGK